MKIAICIYGHLNDWESKYDGWLNFLNKLRNINGELSTFDLFVHTWDFNLKNNKSVQLLTDQSLLNFKNFLSPKIIKVDNQEKYFNRELELNSFAKQFTKDDSVECIAANYATDLYSIMMSSHLKRTFELENDIEYDICIAMSTHNTLSGDHLNLILDTLHIPTDKNIVVANGIKTFQFPYDKIDYNLYYANSHTFDVISSIYNMLPMLNKLQFNPYTDANLLFGFFLRMFDIKIKRLNISYKQKQYLI